MRPDSAFGISKNMGYLSPDTKIFNGYAKYAMTNKDFFIKVIEAEAPIFKKVLAALPKDKLDFKPHERARSAESLALQLAFQPASIASTIEKGSPDIGSYDSSQNSDLEELVMQMESNFEELRKALSSVSDDEWENDTAVLEWTGGKWEAKKYDMAWQLLFDAIHHRGQLTTYLRAMGAKVPSVYGGSADEPIQS